MSVLAHQITVTPDDLDEFNRAAVRLPASATSTGGRVLNMRIEAPALSEATTGAQAVALSHRVGDPPEYVDAWSLLSEVGADSGLAFTPGSNANVLGTPFGTLEAAHYSAAVPLYLVYSHTATDGVFVGPVRVDIIVEE